MKIWGAVVFFDQISVLYSVQMLLVSRIWEFQSEGYDLGKFFSVDGVEKIARIFAADVIIKIVSELCVMQKFSFRVVQLGSQFPEVL